MNPWLLRALPTSAPRRRGVALPVVVVLLLLVSLGTTMLQYASRQRYREAHRATSGTLAAALAESGLNAVLEQMREGMETPETRFYRDLIEGTPETLNGVGEVLEHPLLDELASSLDDATIQVRLEYRDFRTFHPAQGLKGIHRDPREKYGQVVLRSTGSYRGVVQSYEVVKTVKVVSVTAPTLSKFTLFVREQGEVPVNCLRYDRLRPNSTLDREGEAARPLILFHRNGKLPTLEGEAFHPTGALLSDLEYDGGGLVFLGGRDPWYLNLVHGSGAGPFEELFHLRRARMISPSPSPGVRYDYRLWYGFYDGILDGPPFQAAVSSFRYPRRPTGEEVRDLTSALHLYGDVFNVSPTVVLGPVYRSYLEVPLRDGLWYPFLEAGEYAALPGTPTITPYATYTEAMTRVVEDSYNRSYDFLLTNSEALQPDGEVEADGAMPMVPGRHLLPEAMARLEPASPGDQGFLYPEAGSAAPGQVTLRRLEHGGDRTPLFQGTLEDLDGELLESLLRAKVVFSVEDQAAFHETFGTGPLELPGVVLVENGGLEIGERVLEKGAMILAPGDIEVTGYLSQNQPGQPLTLVSLEGDVHVQTGEMVQAALVALRGTAHFPRGQVNLLGSVAVGRLDLPSLVAGAGVKWLTYNEDLDPTDGLQARGQLRGFMARDHGLRIEGF